MVDMKPKSLINNIPESASIEITTKCSLDCVYCTRKREAGINLEWNDFLLLKDRLKAIPDIKRITFCGIGESFLHPRFYDMIHELKDYKISVITSGTINIDFDRLISCNNIDIIIFSIDEVTKKGIQDICGKVYNYENLIGDLNNLNEVNRSRKSKIMSVLNCTVNEFNFNRLSNMIDFAVEQKFTAIHYSLPWMNEKFVIENYDEITNQFRIAAQKAKKSNIYMENPFDSYCCITFKTIMPYINIKGEYFPCGYGLNKNFIVGNIYKDNFQMMWESKANLDYRQGMLCNECYFNIFRKIRVSKENEKQRIASV